MPRRVLVGVGRTRAAAAWRCRAVVRDQLPRAARGLRLARRESVVGVVLVRFRLARAAGANGRYAIGRDLLARIARGLGLALCFTV